jgi:hypothetical protein
MAKAALRDDGADPEARVLLRLIEDRYRQLEGLPTAEKPESTRQRSPSPRYLALEAEIRDYAQRFWKLTE